MLDVSTGTRTLTPMALSITRHAVEQCKAKGFKLRDVVDAVQRPDFSYDSFKHQGQRKYIANGLCVVVDEARCQIITVFLHLVRTELRPDQKVAAR